MSNVDVSILVVSYNTRDLTVACLERVKSFTQSSTFELIVVDNASADGSGPAIAQAHPGVRLIELDENVGFGRGMNLAAEEATGRYLLLLNPDALLLDAAIDQVVEAADRNPGFGIYGGRTLEEDGSDTQSSCWNEPTLWSIFCRASGLAAIFEEVPFFNPERFFYDEAAESVPVDIIAGCFLLIRRPLWDDLHGFDPRFFMYGEDFDLCLRARTLGQPALMLPRIQITHVGGASENVASDRIVRLFRAKVQHFDLHWKPAEAWLGRRLLMVWAFSRRIGYRVAGSLGRRGGREAAESWDEIWRRRREYVDFKETKKSA